MPFFRIFIARSHDTCHSFHPIRAGNYIDVYDMTQAVEDGATRPVYYESRVIKLHLDDNIIRLIDAEYDLMA